MIPAPQKNKCWKGLTPSSTAYEVARFFIQQQKPLLIVLPTSQSAEVFIEDLKFFLGNKTPLHFFPNLDVLPYFQLSPHPEILTTRLSTLYEMSTARKPFIVISSYTALARRLPPKSIFNTYADYVVSKEEIDREGLLNKLIEAGYLSVPLVEDSGSFSVRGGILDVFPPHSSHPYRIEFFGDQVESIRLFEPATQRSLKEVEDLVLLPAREVILNETTLERAQKTLRERFDELGTPKSERELILTPLKNRLPFPGVETFLPFFYENSATLFDYLASSTEVFWISPEEGRHHLEKLWEELISSKAVSTSPEKMVAPEENYLSLLEFEERKTHYPAVEINPTLSHLSASDEDSSQKFFKVQGNALLKTKILAPSAGGMMLEPLANYFRECVHLGDQLILIASSESQALRMKDLFSRVGLHLSEFEDSFFSFVQNRPSVSAHYGGIFLTLSTLSEGFKIEGDRSHFILDAEIFGHKTKRAPKKLSASQTFSTFEELKAGDYVVHQEHGVGLYKNLTKLSLGPVEGEFLLLEYLGGDKLYLPVYRLHLIQRFTGEEGCAPQLDKLGGTHWAKEQEKVKKAIRAMAGELLRIYATRATRIRKSYEVDESLYEEFEAAFPYEETRDQAKAIQEVIQDMASDKPMDRLICGDVGFGKTEVALRAAFRSVVDGRQVAVLVPTTVLAYQHYETFQSRLKDFGIKVEMLSRFRNTSEQKEIVQQLNQGQIDVVIGTHRLFQSDLKYRNLGLLIIDEEHRFGVAHKEKIKKFREMVDVLTLTATPIPRTLNLSLFQMRDLSVINTPPADRMAVRTYVAHFDEGLIREAILREFQRGGQVFFVHNRVQSIQAMADRLKSLVPEAKIVVAHGQMDEKELEQAMMDFHHKKANILLSTVIIESGLDFPSANTILINRADCMGLAQLYQLRGRVGRSNLRAFCYLLIPNEVAITPEARARLNVLQRFTELGSGFKVAAHDMEIRGAGNLLGAEQHGHVASIGYEMYMKLLEETIQEMRGNAKTIQVDPEFHFLIPAVIPETFVADPGLRLGLYKRISQAADEEAIDGLQHELQDRFGVLPKPLMHLLMLMRIKLVAKRLLIESIHQEKTRMIYKFHLQTPIAPESLLQRMKKSPKQYQLTPDYQWITPQKELVDEKILESVYQFLIGLEMEIPQA